MFLHAAGLFDYLVGGGLESAPAHIKASDVERMDRA
jgi:hypothetical protein